MNEDTYNIASATSISGENLIIPIKWDFESVNVLKVVAVANGNAEILNSGYSWNDTLKQLEVQNNYGYEEWSVYVMREEDAQNVLQLISTSEVNAQNVVEQFNRTNRVVQQIQVNQRASICVPDKVNGLLPDVNARKGKFISFDDYGNPVANIEVDTLDKNREKARAWAVGDENDAETKNNNAKYYAETAQASALSSSSYTIKARAWAIGDENDAETKNNNARHYAETAQASALSSSSYTIKARAWAIGDENDAETKNNNARHYADSARGFVNGFNGEVDKATTTFNKNASDKKDEFDKNCETKKGEINQIASAVNSKVDGFDSKVDEATRDFNSNALSKKADFNSNAIIKTGSFNSNASSKLTQFNNNASGVLSQVKGYATEAKNARDKAVLISDPEGWRTGTRAMIDSLAVAKANRGEFYFNGGALQIDSLKYVQGNSFSFAVNFRANKDYFVDSTKQVSILDCGILYLYFHANLKLLSFHAPNALNLLSVDERVNDRLLNGQMHSLIVTYDGTTLKLTDETGELMSTSVTLQSQGSSSKTKIGSNLNGQLSNIRYFNFDMSANDAPYTIADYISGENESPLLQGGVLQGGENYSSTSNWTSRWKNASIVATTNTLEVTTTKNEKSSTLPIIVPERSFIAGQTIEVSYDSITTSSNLTLINPQLYITGGLVSYKTITGNQLSAVVEKTGTGNLEFTIKVNESNIPEGTTFVITGLKIKVNGALLLLDDAISGVQVLDKSGNKNNANVSGSVLGSKVNNPAYCSDVASFSWAGTATTQKFANSDVAIPANSKVVAYAKSSVGASVKFKCGANSEKEVVLSADTLTEIGTFLNSSQGAFTATPTSTITGKIEVYLTIERF